MNQTTFKNKKGGLLPLPRDKRDIRLGQVITLPALSELPETFSHQPFKIKKQIDFENTNTDFCTSFASCSASELQEGVELSPEWSFAVSKIGDLKSFGTNLRNSCKPHIRYGAVETKDAPYNLQNKPADFVRDIKNWPNLYDKALPHKKKSYVSVKGQYSAFDNIKTTIWYYRNEKRTVMIGLLWGWPLEQIYIDTMSETGFGHAVNVLGWKGNYLIIQNSYGLEAGDKGLHYVHRDVINENFNNYGGFVFIDLSAEDIKREIWTLQQKLLDLMFRLLRMFQKQAKELLPAPVEPIPIIPEPIPEPVTEPQPEPKIPIIKVLYLVAKAIERMENSPKTWNNPGAIKGLNGNFLQFKTYEEGFNYLCNYLQRACSGQHQAYKLTFSVLDFFNVYAPSYDNNQPDIYTQNVVNWVGLNSVKDPIIDWLLTTIEWENKYQKKLKVV